MNVINTVILQFLVSLILVQMEEHAVHRIQPTTHVLVLLVSLVLTAQCVLMVSCFK